MKNNITEEHKERHLVRKALQLEEDNPEGYYSELFCLELWDPAGLCLLEKQLLTLFLVLPFPAGIPTLGCSSSLSVKSDRAFLQFSTCCEDLRH